ncbi:YwqJ-related putative deaminase [Streptomyces sp. I05A-00742]|uniref:YwqJ-related putative deaminase n=1 Tax=Streptomyces sp. I05A-00742 TaxID=2732853 RepID=UPI001489C7A8|nr:YwqJ-related putative deaminase [Streptomyces sp. I05A-00742]
MGVVLPDKLVFVLDLIGVNWPNVDEDDYRDMAKSLRGFAKDVDTGRGDSNVALNRLISTNRGEMTAAIEAHVRKLNGKHLHNLAEGARLLAGAMDGAAVVVAGAKGAAIVQLGILATEVAAAQAAAPLTLGLSELGAIGGVAITRTVVKRILKEAAEAAAQEVLSVVTGPVFAALDAMTTDLIVQVVSDGLGVQDGVNLQQTVQAGKNNLKIASAGGAGGGLVLASAGGGGGGSADLVFDDHEHNTFTGKVHDHSKHLDEKGGKHLHTSRNHFGRTRGRGSLAKAIEEVAEKAMKSLDEAHGQLRKHLNDVGDGLTAAGKSQKRQDQHARDSMNGVKKHHPDQMPADGSGGGSGAGRGGGKGPGGNGGGGGAAGGRPLDPQPGWHGHTANETRHHRTDAQDVSHLSREEQERLTLDQSKVCADEANKPKDDGGRGPREPGKDRVKTGCAGSLLHNGVITSHTSFQRLKISGDLPPDRAARGHAAQTPTIHPAVQQALDDIEADAAAGRGTKSIGHGNCAEVALISDRLHQMDPNGTHIRTPEDARNALDGAVVHTRQIGRQKGVEPLEHGDYKRPCDSCETMLPRLGVRAIR